VTLKKLELLIKSREAMLSAVQIYNNPQVTFKSESYITLAVIAWTYMLHCYYANHNVDYRYFHMKGKRIAYDRTKHGAYKHWELERCLDEKSSPIDYESTNNIKFLIGVRHEIEHQMTENIDESISAKLQACSINYNYYIKTLFEDRFGVDNQLGLAIQFSPIQPTQEEQLKDNTKVTGNVKKFICTFEDHLTDEDIINPRYSYRVLFTRLNAKRKGQADKVIEFLPDGTEGAEQLNKTYMLIKETEKKKYLSKDVVELMHAKGYYWFTVGAMTQYWKYELKNRDQYGIYITNTQWMWYDNWIPVVEAYCEKEASCMVSNNPSEKPMYANDIVNLMKEEGYKNFSTYWLGNLWKYKIKINRNHSSYGHFDRNKRFIWHKEWIPIVEKYCSENAMRFGKI
jgi:hypothetical protein